MSDLSPSIAQVCEMRGVVEFSLHTQAPGEYGTLPQYEVEDSGYRRAQPTDEGLSFGQFTGPSVVVTHLALLSAKGTIVDSCSLLSSKEVSKDIELLIAPGALTLQGTSEVLRQESTLRSARDFETLANQRYEGVKEVRVYLDDDNLGYAVQVDRRTAFHCFYSDVINDKDALTKINRALYALWATALLTHYQGNERVLIDPNHDECEGCLAVAVDDTLTVWCCPQDSNEYANYEGLVSTINAALDGTDC